MKTKPNYETQIDTLIDIMAELGTLETRIRTFRESMEPIVDKMYQVWFDKLP
ncbi:MAG: hypothetical protein ABJN40_01635 [Sneathiella sp.]